MRFIFTLYSLTDQILGDFLRDLHWFCLDRVLIRLEVKENLLQLSL